MPASTAADPVLDAILAELIDDHGCHTVVLYGSRARGAQTATSDYDVLGLWDKPEKLRIAHQRHGGYMDAFIHPEALLTEPVEPQLKLRGGQVLRQRDDMGDRLLARVEARFQVGPEPCPPDELAASRAWAGKMLARIAQGDVEAHYRRAMLLYQLLEDYFAARGQWYLGPKAAFAWLAEHDVATHRAFALALAPGAGSDELAALASQVWEGA